MSLTTAVASDSNDAPVNCAVSFPAVSSVLILAAVSDASPVTALASTATVVAPLIVLNSAAVLPVASPDAIVIV